MIKNINCIELIGYPCDLGAGRRGVDMGPSALRIAHLQERIEELGYSFIDDGDIPIKSPETQKVSNNKLRYLKEIRKTSLILAEKVRKSLEKKNFPLCVGGDHSMALGTIAGIADYCRQHNQRLGVIWIDAHTDMNTDETTPSGNIHGMPLAASLGLGTPELTDLLGFSPKVKAEDCVVIGARSIDNREKENIRKTGLKVYTMSDVDTLGIKRIISRVLTQFKGKIDHIHVSFDVDGIDPALTPGVGTPVKGGLTYREAHLLMETLADCGCMSSLEVSELNPILDIQNKSAEFVTELVASSFGKRIL